jgi:hypothetical protein
MTYFKHARDLLFSELLQQGHAFWPNNYLKKISRTSQSSTTSNTRDLIWKASLNLNVDQILYLTKQIFPFWWTFLAYQSSSVVFKELLQENSRPLRRLAFPCRYADMIQMFGRPVPELCMIPNEILDFIYEPTTFELRCGTFTN